MSTQPPSDPILSIAQAVLSAEIEALTQVKQLLGNSFLLAIRELSNLSPAGKIIISGMGKAGFIAMKISATFASVGIPSFFLHPAEAIHGDLGRFTKNDIALILSNSGETPEILRLIPHLKKVGCPTLALTATSASSLAKHCDISICYGKYQEAEPLGVAPTVSTTVMLAIGDALAMAVAAKIGITREQFAQFHPGGELGKALTLVEKVMRTGDKHCVVNQEMIVRLVIQAMIATSGRLGAVSVVDNTGKLTGILTDGDVRRHLGDGAEFLEQPVSLIMGNMPKTITADKLVEDALSLMKKFAIDELIVVDNESKPVGIIDIQDIIALQTS